MSRPQTIAVVAPRSRIRRATLATALGVLVAIAVSVVILALTGANHTTAATRVTASQPAGSSTPHTHYLGPRQVQAAPNPQSRGGSTPTAGAANPAPHYACLGAAQGCDR